MSKRFERIVEHCTVCPNVTYDQNITRWVCRPRNKMICWMGDGEDSHPIPDWCPLADEKACLHCKSENVTTTGLCDGNDSFAVICDGCGAEGPTGVDEEDAENQWIDRKYD